MYLRGSPWCGWFLHLLVSWMAQRGCCVLRAHSAEGIKGSAAKTDHLHSPVPTSPARGIHFVPNENGSPFPGWPKRPQLGVWHGHNCFPVLLSGDGSASQRQWAGSGDICGYHGGGWAATGCDGTSQRPDQNVQARRLRVSGFYCHPFTSQASLTTVLSLARISSKWREEKVVDVPHDGILGLFSGAPAPGREQGCPRKYALNAVMMNS